MTHPLQWQKFPVLDQGFICLVDVMGDDSSIVQAARVSYNKDKQKPTADPNCPNCKGTGKGDIPGSCCDCKWIKLSKEDRALIRYLMNHSHTTPFEMVEIKFMVQVPMDAWRQWVRHRTANINEYSTRYTEALDFMQQTDAEGWRLQALDNKQGSSGLLEDWPFSMRESEETIDGREDWIDTGFTDEKVNVDECATPGEYLHLREAQFHRDATELYQERLAFGIAKEQARKDLPLSTYTRLYWKCDLHNIFNFLRLRMDSHAQLEIRSYANAMYEIVKQICPIACEAFEDYVLHAKKFSRMEMDILKSIASDYIDSFQGTDNYKLDNKPSSMTDREWKAFLEKLQ